MSKGVVENHSEVDPKIEKVNAKIEKGGKEIGTGVSDVVSGTTTMVAKTFNTGLNLVGSCAAKLGEVCTKKYNKSKRARKAEKARIRFEKAKSSGKKAVKSVSTVFGGGLKAIQGTGRIAVHSVNKSIKEMSAEEKIPETTGNPESIVNQAA